MPFCRWISSAAARCVLEELLQLRRQVEDAPLAVLRRAGVEPDLADLEVDLPPLQRQHLAVDPPPGDVRERHDRSHARRADALAPPGTARARRTRRARCPPAASAKCGLWMQLPRLDREAEHPLQHRELAIDLAG